MNVGNLEKVLGLRYFRAKKELKFVGTQLFFKDTINILCLK
jgi:hypothetical protein